MLAGAALSRDARALRFLWGGSFRTAQRPQVGGTDSGGFNQTQHTLNVTIPL